MKKILALTGAGIAVALAGGTLALAGNRLNPVWGYGALLIILTLALILMTRESRIMAFLLKESKKHEQFQEASLVQSEKQRVQSELSMLQYQINPHFLYNTLDTIRSYALMSDQEDIALMSEKLSRFFRYAISNRENIVKVEDELRHIEDYLFIQSRRFGDRFETEISLEEPELRERYMLKLMIQPLVENAITHGLERLKRKGWIHIHIAATEKKLLIRISDNGVGMNEEKLCELNHSLRSGTVQPAENHRRGTGIAVQNVNARIRITFGEEYGLHYRSHEMQGTTVTATLPLLDDFSRQRYQEAQ